MRKALLSLVLLTFIISPYSLKSMDLRSTEQAADGPRVIQIYNNHSLRVLRDKTTSIEDFRKHTHRVSTNLASKAEELLAQPPFSCDKQVEFETPMGLCRGSVRAKDICLIPILRAGLAMLPDFIDAFPRASVWFVGLERVEHHDSTSYKAYYNKPPEVDPENTVFIIIDPMLASGGSMKFCIDLLKEGDIPEESILLASIISAQQGIDRLRTECPRLGGILTAAIDPELNETFYIVPGLGDFGDRYFGTPVGGTGLHALTELQKKFEQSQEQVRQLQAKFGQRLEEIVKCIVPLVQSGEFDLDTFDFDSYGYQ